MQPDMLMPWIADYFSRLEALFLSPEKRLFIGYILAAIVIVFFADLLLKHKGGKENQGKRPSWKALKTFFSPGIWGSYSARADYMMIIINQFVMMIISPLLLSRLLIATFIFEMIHIVMNGRPILEGSLPDGVIWMLFTLTYFLLDDFTKYYLHRLLHHWPILWAYHKIHHSAETLTPLTILRTHPVEAILFSLRGTLVQAVALSFFVFFFAGQVDLLQVWGVNIFLFAFNILGANLRHSHISLSWGAKIERIFISPVQHQIHHSITPCHHNKNFGSVLALWDWLGGSLHIAPASQSMTTHLTFGMNTRDKNTLTNDAIPNLKALYVDPLRESFYISLDFLNWVKKMGFNQNRSGKVALLSLATLAGLFFAISSFVGSARAEQEKILNIYSHRQPFLIQPFIEAYSKKTGVKVNIVYAPKGLLHRLQSEGKNSPADMVLTVDIGRLVLYADKGLFAPVSSEILAKNVPLHLRDPHKRWFGLSKRARVIAVAKDAGISNDIKNMEDLAKTTWRGRICSRPGSHVYNRALLASIIAARGEKEAQEWVAALLSNLARRPQGDDRAQVKAIFEGECDIAIINHYYHGKLTHSKHPEHRNWADAITLIFPNQENRGTHINISGAGVTKYAPHRQRAIEFLEFLTQEEAQKLYGYVNFEYPVNSLTPLSSYLQKNGAFKEDHLPIAKIGELALPAQKIIDRTGW